MLRVCLGWTSIKVSSTEVTSDAGWPFTQYFYVFLLNLRFMNPYLWYVMMALEGQMYFLGEQKKGPAWPGHCHKSPITSRDSPVGVPKFGVKNSWVQIPKPPDQHGQIWPETGPTGPTWPKSPGLDPPFRCPFPFRTSEGHLELSLVVFLGDIQRIGLAKLSTSYSHKKHLSK